MRILKEDTVAVMVDIQEKLIPHMSETDLLLQQAGRLIDGLKALQVPILITEQYRKGLGETQSSLQQKFDAFSYLEKTAFSCCDDDAFLSKINFIGKKNVLLFGIESHICVLQTAIDLLANGYIVVVVDDAVSSRNPNDKLVAMERLKQEGAIVTTVESILFEMCRYSGTDVFKIISKLIK